MPEMTCIFDHVQKTGGTAWATFVQANYPHCRVSPLILHEDIRFAHAVAGEHEFVSGHFELSPEYRWPSDVYHMTLVREPVDRFLSHFYYVRASQAASEPFAQLARAHDLDAAIALGDPEFERHIRHFYIRHFLQGMYPKPTVDHLLATESFSVHAVAGFVLGHYDLVGLTEHMGLAADCFGHHMRGVTGAEMPVERATAQRPALADLAPATLAELRRLSAADRALYDALSAGFFATLRRVIASARETGRTWRTRPAPLPSAARPHQPVCLAEGIDVFCPARPVNNRVECGQHSTLSAVFRMLIPASSLTVRLLLRNQLHQVAYRDSVSVALEGQRVEISWSFTCALGAGTYDCDFEVVALDAAGQGIQSTSLDSAYQFEVATPPAATAAGATWLAPSVAVSSSANRPGPLFGRIVVPERRVAAEPGALLRLPISVRNVGREAWRCSGFHRVVMGVTITTAGRAPLFDHASRLALPHDVQPGHELILEMTLAAPAEPGEHVVWVGVVQEWVSWFCIDEPGIALTVAPAPRTTRRQPAQLRQQQVAA